MAGKILLIDDDANLLSSLKRQLRRTYAVETAVGGQDALFILQTHGPFAVVVCDMRMPGMDGIQVLRKVREMAPATVRIMLTGNADQQTAIDAVNEGAIFRFFTKPCSQETLERGLDAALEQYRLVTAEKELLEKTLGGSVRLMMDILALSAPQAFGQSTRLRDWVRRLTAELNMPPRWQLELAAMLCPIGQVTIPPEVLQKVAEGVPLSPVEKGMIAQSPEAARKLIAHIPRLAGVAEAVALQDRGYDGSGLPHDGPKGDAIPFDARFIKVLKDIAALCHNDDPSPQTFAVLDKRAGRYDPLVYRKIRDCMLAWPPTTRLANLPREALGHTALSADQVLAENMELENGRMVLAAGTRLTGALVERIRNLGQIQKIREPIQVIQPWDLNRGEEPQDVRARVAARLLDPEELPMEATGTGG